MGFYNAEDDARFVSRALWKFPRRVWVSGVLLAGGSSGSSSLISNKLSYEGN